MIWLLTAVAGAATVYQALTLVAAIFHRRSKTHRPSNVPVSILKPVHGSDPGFYDAIRTHAVQQFPAFEILFGVRDPGDPARKQIEQLIADFPGVPMRLVICRTTAPNPKVGVLIDLANAAQHPILIVNDSDISVPADYVQRVTAPLADSGIGLVTCLYRADASDAPSRFEALAIATEFAPNALVAPLFGVSDFGLGSTLAFRKIDLDRLGGFRAIADYLADDYQLGCKLHALGLRNIISDLVVTTRISSGSWRGAWHHQLRWARTIRLSRGAGYAGLPITFATFWACVAALAGAWWLAVPVLAIRIAVAIACGWLVLGSADVLRYFYWIPLRDLGGAVIWAAGLFGNTVLWRDRRLRLDKQGRIIAGETRG